MKFSLCCQRATQKNGAMFTEINKITIAALILALLLCLTACAKHEAEPPTETVQPAGETVDFLPTAPSPEAAPVETAEPVELPEKEPLILTVRLPETPFYELPDHTLKPEKYLQSGEQVECIGEEGNFVLARLEDTRELWVHRWYLEAADSQLEAERQESILASLMASESFVPMEEAVYTSTASNLNCREKPDIVCAVLCLIPKGTQVTVLGADGEFYLCRLEDGSYVYCSKLYLTDGMLYASIDGAVDLRQYLKNAEFEILFASENNIAGYPLYPAVPVLEITTATLLKRAFEIFYEDGYIIKIYDAYRPKSAQYVLYNILPDNRYLANPYVGNSWHQLGRAVDMSLIDIATGEELEMPTEMHGFRSEASRRKSSQWTEAARNNVDYMTSVMESVGFSTIDTEWWHFEYLGSGGYLPVDLDLNSVEYTTGTE